MDEELKSLGPSELSFDRCIQVCERSYETTSFDTLENVILFDCYFFLVQEKVMLGR